VYDDKGKRKKHEKVFFIDSRSNVAIKELLLFTPDKQTFIMSCPEYIEPKSSGTNTMSYNYRVADTSKPGQILKTYATENNATTDMSEKVSCPITDNTVPRQHMFVRHEVNLESHQLIWCDENVHNTSDINNKRTLEELLRIVKCTKLFDDIDECQQFIQQTQNTTTYLVCSISLAQTLVSQIHQFEKLRSINLYCPSVTDWSTSWIYSKMIK
jgi:hypothetical protein